MRDRRLTFLLLALLAVSCGRATASRDDAGQQDNANAVAPAAATSPSAPANANAPTAASSPAAERATPTAAVTPDNAAEKAKLAADRARLAEGMYQRDVETVATLNQTWNATLESNPLAKGWVRITLVSQGKVKLEGEMPDNDVNDGFMSSVVSVFGAANIENHIRKFEQPCGRDGRGCGQEKKQAPPSGAGA